MSLKSCRLLSFVALAFTCDLSAAAEARWSVSSPDGALVLTAVGGAAPTLSVSRRQQLVVTAAAWGISTKRGGSYPGELRGLAAAPVVIDESYVMPVGKRSRCRNHANELTVDFSDAGGLRFSLILRAYNEGVAYRYRIHGTGEDTVTGEASGLCIPAGARGWLGRYTSNYESIYREHAGLAGVKEDLQFPLLFQFPGKQWVYFTEAAVDGGYAGARVKVLDAAQGLLGIALANPPTSALPWTTPWRVMMVAEDLRQVVESTLVNDLSPPSAIADTAWIQPGAGIFPWLTGPSDGAGPCRRNNNGSLERMKEFVDQASAMGWKWIEFDNALALGTAWGGPPEKWMDCPWFPQLTAYAATKNIAVYGWDHWHNLDTPEKRKTQFDWYVAKGFKGIKVDFFDSDEQVRYRLREDLARDCAAHRLLISYHGDITPRGMQRTWPNIATHEGVLGEEYYLGFSDDAPSPAYNVNLVFTRNVPGSMDYTPASFDNPGKNGSRTTTNAHQMALPVVFESGWQAMGFNPESVKPLAPACAFLKDLPTAWDDIRLVAGQPNDFAVVARRKADDWWIAGINAGTARELRLDLGFLTKGAYQCTLYHDAPPPAGAGPLAPLDTRIAADALTVDPAQPLVIALPANGGFGLRIVAGAKGHP